MRSTKTAETILFSILFLFFLQVISDFIEAIYAFGLLVTAFTIEVASILLLFTPLVLVFFRKPPTKVLMLGLSCIAIGARLLEPLLSPSGKLVACGVSVGVFMLLFPVLLHNRSSVRGWQIGSGLAIAVSLSIFFRTVNSSLDLSEYGMFQIISWLLAIVAANLLWRTDVLSPQEISTAKASSGWRLTSLSIGLASVILMLYFAFTSPTVIARWTGNSYPVIVTTLVVVLAVFGALLTSDRFSSWLTPRAILSWNVLFLLLLVLTILPHQITFPSNPDAYPVNEPPVSALATLFLVLMLAFFPVIFIDFMLFARQISLEKPSLPQMGRSFAVAALFFLVMIFFHVFTSIYDYAPVVGLLFRDRFWIVYFLAGLGMGLPVLLVHQEAFLLGKPEDSRMVTPLILGSLALLSILSLPFTTPHPTVLQISTGLEIMTYNIQQGFDANGNKNLDGQLAVIRKVNPDVLGLQESDTARVANGNVDAVRYFADHLNMHSYYGPKTTAGTFGIALLSKYPIQNPITFFMYSSGEQTATIHAEIRVSGKTYQIFVTHLGNGGPIFQLEDLLKRTKGPENVIVMGDFNFDTTTDQYGLITTTLADSWLLKWPGGKETPGISAENRIDHIFVSPTVTVLESEYGASPASDHPYMYTINQT